MLRLDLITDTDNIHTNQNKDTERSKIWQKILLSIFWTDALLSIQIINEQQYLAVNS